MIARVKGLPHGKHAVSAQRGGCHDAARIASVLSRGARTRISTGSNGAYEPER